MDRKRKIPQKNKHSVQTKKKPIAEFEVQCEIGSNIYRMALKRKQKNLLLSQMPHSSVSNLNSHYYSSIDVFEKNVHFSQLLTQHNKSAVHRTALKVILQHEIS